MTRRAMITYPTGRVLGVIDDADAAVRAAAALVGDGIAAPDVEVVAGPGAAERLSHLGPPPNLLSRVVRAFQFLSMDQLPDLLVYERAVHDGRAVIAVRVDDRDAMLRVRDRLEAAGAHFINHFGRLSTEELTRWRGDEPDLPGVLRR